MPILPENKGRYPANWKTEIRPAILKRAKNRCEQCGVLNHAVIARGGGDDAGTYAYGNGCLFCDRTGRPLGVVRGSEYDLDRVIKVILTIAHLDHQPENNDPSNLKAFCQLCHNRHDAEHRKQTRRRRCRERNAIGDLFEQKQGI